MHPWSSTSSRADFAFPEQQFVSNRRGGPHYQTMDAYGDRYDRLDAYTMQQEVYPQRHAYGGRSMHASAPRSMPGSQARMMDRGGRSVPPQSQQQRGHRAAGFGAAQRPAAAAPTPAEKGRLPQEAYIKRQSMRWLIKQRLLTVLFPIHPNAHFVHAQTNTSQLPMAVQTRRHRDDYDRSNVWTLNDRALPPPPPVHTLLHN